MQKQNAMVKIVAYSTLLIALCASLHHATGIDSRKGSFSDINFESRSNDLTSTKVLMKATLPSNLACSQKCFANENCVYKKFEEDAKRCTLYQSVSGVNSNQDFLLQAAQKIPSICFTHPCGTACQCMPAFDAHGHFCQCNSPGVSKSSKEYVHRTCKDALTANGNVSSSYKVQPSLQHGPVLIKCEMGVDEQAYAVFNHDTETEIIVTGSPDHCGGYQRQFKYKDVMETMTLVVDNSIHCEQLTVAICKGVVFVGRSCSWLTGRNSQRLSFWGGGPADGVGCACGLNNSCVDVKRKCNCDINDNYSLQRDEGYVVERNVLPLTGIAIGDTVSVNVEVVRYTIGPLKCIL